MKFLKSLLIVTLVLLSLNGCSSKGGAEGEEAAVAGAGAPGAGKAGGPRISKYPQGREGGRYGAGGAGSYGAGGAGRYGGAGGSGDIDSPSGPLAKRVVFFLYDSYEVQPQYQSVVSAHASYLAAHPEQNVVLEGHADERGSPEYNVALGEQRAKAVQRMMQLQGAAEGQIQVVSFGEEKPAEPGHDEASWQQNRRVEISYPGH